MSNIKNWIEALRPRTLPLSLACVAMGSILAYAYSAFRWDIFVMSLVTTLLLQLLSNIANDYGDSVSGVDGDDREGPSRLVQSGKITLSAMFRAMVLLAILSLISGIYLIYLGVGFSSAFWVFISLGLAAIAAAIGYTVGKRPYGYAGLGDASVFVFFGLIGVMGTYYLHAQSINALTILPAMSCSFFAVAVLNVNNIRDIESDQRNGKISIPVRLGRERAIVYHQIILILGILSAVMFVVIDFRGWWQLLFLIVIPLLLKNARAVRSIKNAKLLDPFLKQMAMTTLIFVVTFGIGLYLAMHATS